MPQSNPLPPPDGDNNPSGDLCLNEDDGCAAARQRCHSFCIGITIGVGLGSGASGAYRKCMRNCLPPHCADNY